MNVLTSRHRAAQLLVRKNTIAQIRSVWPALDYEDLDGSLRKLATPAARVVEKNRQTSAGLSAGYLRAFRKDQGINGTLKLVLAAQVDAEQFLASLTTVSVANIKRATANGVARDVAMSNGLTLTMNAMARLALDGGRDTILRTSQEDPAAVGWRRVLGGPGCDFCQQQAGRGAIYFSDDTAGFQPHDKCGCTPEPEYRA